MPLHFVVQIVPALAIGKLFVVACVPLCLLKLLGVSAALLFSTVRCSRLNSYNAFSNSRISHFSKDVSSFIGEWVLSVSAVFQHGSLSSTVNAL